MLPSLKSKAPTRGAFVVPSAGLHAPAGLLFSAHAPAGLLGRLLAAHAAAGLFTLGAAVHTAAGLLLAFLAFLTFLAFLLPLGHPFPPSLGVRTIPTPFGL